MTRVVLSNEQVVAALDAIKSRSEICDSQGRVLGVYVPQSAENIRFNRGAKSPYSREELERIYQEEAKDARPLSEFWERMREKYPNEFQ